MTENLLEYASWKILNKYKNHEQKVNAFVFNKTMSVLNQQLIDIYGLNIKLPRCWYYYGEQVVPIEMPSQVRCEGLGMEDIQTTFKWIGNSPIHPRRKDKKKIDSQVNSLISKFPPNEDIHELVDKVYEYAPYEFQIAYSKFRSDFQLMSDVDKDGKIRSKLLYKNDFKKAIECFPHEDFPNFKVPAKKIELIVYSIFDECPEQNKLGVNLAKDFWEIFCKFLRINEKGHYYVSQGIIDNWTKIAIKDMKKYKENLHLKISDVFSECKLDSLNDPLINAFLQPVSLGESYKKFSSEIDTIVYGG